MIVEYCFASQGGDLPADLQTLDRPFLLSPRESHPSLMLRDYFDAIRAFVLQSLPAIAPENESPPDRVIIRSEKHGALHHVASVEVYHQEQSRKFAVNTALSNRGKLSLNQEEILLKQLEKSFRLPYLPRPCFKAEVPAGGRLTLPMLMTEWFGDYHEWHLTADQSHTLCIWDQKTGNRFALEKEISGIYRESSKILALYYDTQTFRQIRPWHHAAGDFVVNSEDEKVRVRLTTVRGYEPLKLFRHAGPVNPVIGLVYFFLDLSTKMRLDRIEGTGDVIWADDFCLGPVIEGVLDALRITAGQGRLPPGDPEDLMRLLKAFSGEEMASLFRPLLELYETEDAGDFSILEKNLGNHIDSLLRVIRKFPE